MRYLPIALLFQLILVSPTTSEAIPICPTGTMRDYLAFDRCRFGLVTFSDFSYSGEGADSQVFPFVITPVVPSRVRVVPSFGDPVRSVVRLSFFVDVFWTGLTLEFDVSAPYISANRLWAQGGGFWRVQALSRPGGSMETFHEFLMSSPSLDQPTHAALFDPVKMQHVVIDGFGDPVIGGIRNAAFDVVTPEPATLFLVGTTAAGLGVIRWSKRRRNLTP